MSGARRASVLAIVVIVTLAAVLPAGPFYLTNDDVAMRLLAEGRFAAGAPPSPFLMFINVIVGGLLASLYTIANALPWYDVLMAATAITATVALVIVWTAPGDVVAWLRALLLAASSCWRCGSGSWPRC